MIAEEIPLTFKCHTSTLIGILHKPSNPKNTGIIIVTAGGPQYRVGRARQQVLLGRRLAQEGYSVLRFDYRGLGDSAGQFQGFQHIDDDIAAAISKISDVCPYIDSIVLWGECNAASAIMSYAWQNSLVTTYVIENPWARNQTTQAKAYLKRYYLMRIMQKGFWLKLISLKFNPIQSLKDFWALLKNARKKAPKGKINSNLSDTPNFHEKMLEGLAKFNGRVLLVMNLGSLRRLEFDELTSSSKSWLHAMKAAKLTRVEFSLSTREGRTAHIENTIKWLAETE